jgi:hypothetical protein
MKFRSPVLNHFITQTSYINTHIEMHALTDNDARVYSDYASDENYKSTRKHSSIINISLMNIITL